jgi:hypothetical protein
MVITSAINNKRQAKKEKYTQNKRKRFVFSFSLEGQPKEEEYLQSNNHKIIGWRDGDDIFGPTPPTTHKISHAVRVFLFHEEITMTTRADISSLSFYM